MLVKNFAGSYVPSPGICLCSSERKKNLKYILCEFAIKVVDDVLVTHLSATSLLLFCSGISPLA